MKRVLLAVILLAGVTLACGQYVGTPTPEVTPEPQEVVPSVSPSPDPRPTTAPTATAEADTATVRAALVNVRQSPNGDVIGSLEAGTDVRVIACADGWCEVEADELTGYIFQGCLSISDGQGCEAK